MPLGEAMQGLAGDELLRDLTLECAAAVAPVSPEETHAAAHETFKRLLQSGSRGGRAYLMRGRVLE